MKTLKHFFLNTIKKPLHSVFTTSSKIENLLCDIGQPEIRDKSILITEYPFEPSSVYPQKEIYATAILAISTDFGTCKIYLKNDIVFISSSSRTELESFRKRNKINTAKQSWNWDWILEPYLDTELSPTHERLTLERLKENGFTETEVEAIRKEIEDQMLKYNFDTMLWEWCSLGIIDVLSAMKAKYNKQDFKIFYARAIEIENRVK
ncbi:hypothetical protein [Flavobacterium algicola]|uniref:hypothetical protein n=1 Tax=Flavobacterium algicola TaxID=556529 RepID=UPI001EFEE8AE|nr:hypothetical protein [Flavobacterium algicola]MCG9791548.1 hypothetical protein [Flavobacterium algicola]